MSETRRIQAEELTVRVFSDRASMGKAAAEHAAEMIRTVAQQKDEINIIFASAPSQNEFLATLRSMEDLPWSRINAFHMDEYIGLPADAPQGFANFLRQAIFDHLPFRHVFCMNGQNPDPQAECDRYAALLKEYPADIIFMGIGENGHIAFCDPPVADFNDPLDVKIVELEGRCRQQQVNDGCFASFDLVPRNALTLTVPSIFSAGYIACVVPAATKAEAVKNTVEGEIGEYCPATVIRRHNDATLYLDPDSASLLSKA